MKEEECVCLKSRVKSEYFSEDQNWSDKWFMQSVHFSASDISKEMLGCKVNEFYISKGKYLFACPSYTCPFVYPLPRWAYFANKA